MKKLDALEIKTKVIAAGFGLAAETELNMLRRLEDLMLDGIVMGFELLAERVRRADACIAMLTADHNATPNYVKGFDMAQDYFAVGLVVDSDHDGEYWCSPDTGGMYYGATLRAAIDAARKGTL